MQLFSVAPIFSSPSVQAQIRSGACLFRFCSAWVSNEKRTGCRDVWFSVKPAARRWDVSMCCSTEGGFCVKWMQLKAPITQQHSLCALHRYIPKYLTFSNTAAPQLEWLESVPPSVFPLSPLSALFLRGQLKGKFVFSEGESYEAHSQCTTCSRWRSARLQFGEAAGVLVQEAKRCTAVDGVSHLKEDPP